MGLSQYLCEEEITALNYMFDTSLKHDSMLVFWTGISPKLANDWAHKNNLKTLTLAMGSLYANNSRGSLRARKSKTAWSKYMKGASWLYAQKAYDRYAIVLTNAPPNIYSTRKQSNYRDIEEPILKGSERSRHAIQIGYVHPNVSGAAYFCYQTWPRDRSSEWFDFLECITIKNILKNIVSRSILQRSENSGLGINAAPSRESQGLGPFVAIYNDTYTPTTQQRRIAKQDKVEKGQRAAQERREAKKAKVEEEQRTAQGKKAAKRAIVEHIQQAAQERRLERRVRVEKEQQTAQERRIERQARVEKEQQAAQEKKTAKRALVEQIQQAAQQRRIERQAKVEKEQQAAQAKKTAKRAIVEQIQQAAQQRRTERQAKVEKEQQAAQQKKAARRAIVDQV